MVDVEHEFRRKRRYVEHLVQGEHDDFEALFRVLADLRANEAAAVERVRNRRQEPEEIVADG